MHAYMNNPKSSIPMTRYTIDCHDLRCRCRAKPRRTILTQNAPTPADQPWADQTVLDADGPFLNLGAIDVPNARCGYWREGTASATVTLQHPASGSVYGFLVLYKNITTTIAERVAVVSGVFETESSTFAPDFVTLSLTLPFQIKDTGSYFFRTEAQGVSSSTANTITMQPDVDGFSFNKLTVAFEDREPTTTC